MPDIFKGIARILAEQSCHPEDSIKPETTLEDGLEMDSLDVIQAFMLIEDEFDIIVADEEIEPCKTVADIIDLVTKKVGA